MSSKDRPTELTEKELGSTRGLLERFVLRIRDFFGSGQRPMAAVALPQAPKPVVAPRAAVVTAIPKREPEPAAVRRLPEARLTDEMLMTREVNGDDEFVALLCEVGRERAEAIIAQATRTDVRVDPEVLGASQVGVNAIDPRHPNDLAAVYFYLAREWAWANGHGGRRAARIAAVLSAIEKNKRCAPASVQGFMDKVRQAILSYLKIMATEESPEEASLPW